MRMAYGDYRAMPFRSLLNAISGYREAQLEALKQQLSVARSHASWSTPGFEWFDFPWEEEYRKKALPTPEQLKADIDRILKRDSHG